MRLMFGTGDAGVAMSGSSESSNGKWIDSGPIDALVSSYVGANANCDKQMQRRLGKRCDRTNRLYCNKGLTVNDFWAKM